MRTRILLSIVTILTVFILVITGGCKDNSTGPDDEYVDEMLRPFAGSWNVLHYIYTNITDTTDLITNLGAEITIKVELSRDMTITYKLPNYPTTNVKGTIRVKDEDELILNIQGKTGPDTVSFTFSQDSTNLTYIDNEEFINFANPLDTTPENLVAAKLTATLRESPNQ